MDGIWVWDNSESLICFKEDREEKQMKKKIGQVLATQVRYNEDFYESSFNSQRDGIRRF